MIQLRLIVPDDGESDDKDKEDWKHFISGLSGITAHGNYHCIKPAFSDQSQ
jgi:hypothetical protein